MRGCGKLQATDIIVNLEIDGSQVSVEPGREFVQISAIAFASTFENALSVVAECLMDSALEKSQLEMAIESAVADLDVNAMQPEDRASQELQRMIFPPNHPFHFQPTAESLRAINRDIAYKFFKQRYQPPLTTLVITGGFETEDMVAMVKRKFDAWFVTDANAVNAVLSIPDLSMPQHAPEEDIIIPGMVESITLMGHVGVSQCHEDYAASTVANVILGGDTLSSRLGSLIRDDLGLTYGVTSRFDGGFSGGSFTIRMQAKPEDMTQAVSVAWNVINQLVTKGVTDEEVQNARRNLLSSQTLDMASPMNAGIIVQNAILCGNPNAALAPIQFAKRLINITTANVNDILRKYIDANGLARVTIGPQRVSGANWQMPISESNTTVKSNKTVGNDTQTRFFPSVGSRAMCIDQDRPSNWSARDVWFNSFGPRNGKLSGTLSWLPPISRNDVSVFKLVWATSCSKQGIIADAPPVWLDIYRNVGADDTFRYQQQLNEIAFPEGASLILIVSEDQYNNPWPALVGVSVFGN